MGVEGHCNCGKIRVIIDQVPSSSFLCYCDNCKRAGGLASINYTLKLSTVTVKDPLGVLRKYMDTNVASGGSLERQFCGTCGSPILSIMPTNPESGFIKASLFEVDQIPPPAKESFPSKKPGWLGRIPA
ncbi:hypothetical protein FQN55_007979 [Onygenales sp. PD_40]|nr:hypothetical protein FQN55_007979 [Onygenales sp. PD_40]